MAGEALAEVAGDPDPPTSKTGGPGLQSPTDIKTGTELNPSGLPEEDIAISRSSSSILGGDRTVRTHTPSGMVAGTTETYQRVSETSAAA